MGQWFLFDHSNVRCEIVRHLTFVYCVPILAQTPKTECHFPIAIHFYSFWVIAIKMVSNTSKITKIVCRILSTYSIVVCETMSAEVLQQLSISFAGYFDRVFLSHLHRCHSLFASFEQIDMLTCSTHNTFHICQHVAFGGINKNAK